MNRFIALLESGRVADLAGLKSAFRTLAKRVHPDAGSRFGDRASGRPAEPPGDRAFGNAEAAAKAFVILREEYEEARAWLERGRPSPAGEGRGEGAPQPANSSSEPTKTTAGPQRREPKVPEILAWDRRAFYVSFEDLLARGFPRPPSAPWPRRAYGTSRSLVLSYLRGRDSIEPSLKALDDFLAFEAGYSKLAPVNAGWLSVDNDAARSIYFFLTNVIIFHETAFAHVKRIAKGIYPETERLLSSRGESRAMPFLRGMLADLDEGPAITSW
jgi:hypothetical protein